MTRMSHWKSLRRMTLMTRRMTRSMTSYVTMTKKKMIQSEKYLRNFRSVIQRMKNMRTRRSLKTRTLTLTMRINLRIQSLKRNSLTRMIY